MIIVRLSGGLGNQMFQYACGRALSVKYNVPLKLDPLYLHDRLPRPFQYNFIFRHYSLGVFNIKASIVERNETPLYFLGKIGLYIDLVLRRWILKPSGTEKHFQFDQHVLSLGSNTYLDGQWQSPKYFTDIESILKKEFTLKNPPTENIQKLMVEIQKTNSLCVFVRRGDFVGNKNHEVVGKEFYDRGIAEIEKRTTIEKVYVFSDDIPWCEQNLTFSYPTIFVNNEYAGEEFSGHMMLMSQCKNFIIPNSSFSWWAAWLSQRSGKVIICPQQWFPDASIDSSDLVPKDWIRI